MILYHVSANIFDLPAMLLPGRWGARTRELKTDSMIDSANRATLLWETLLELRRRELQPDAVSRLACVFACGTLDAAKRFREKSMTGAWIYEARPVDPNQKVFKGNLETLSGDGSSVPMIDWYIDRSQRYWTEENVGTYLEVLCSGPLTLTRRLED